MAKIWRAGCIIRAKFLDYIKQAYDKSPELATLLVDDYFLDAVSGAQEAWRRVVALAAQQGIPAPGFASALAYYDGLRAKRLPAALIQGQRDFFGAHTYRRVDKPGAFHILWADRRPAGGRGLIRGPARPRGRAGPRQAGTLRGVAAMNAPASSAGSGRARWKPWPSR